MKRVFGSGVLMVSLALIGCGEETDTDIETVQSAYTEASCMLADADHTDVGGIDPAWTSPRTYDNPNCNKAVIVDIPSYSSWYWGAPAGGPPPQYDGRTQVDWNDTLATTQSACTQLWLGATLYRWSAGNQEWSERIRRDAFGQWVQDPWTGAMVCRGPSLAFHSTFAPELIVGRAYRLAITGRTQNSSAAPTRSVRVQSFQPEVIR
jgi:hypothetical protein